MRFRALASVLLLAGTALAVDGGNPHVTSLLNAFSERCGVSGNRYNKSHRIFRGKNQGVFTSSKVAGERDRGEWPEISRDTLNRCSVCFHTAHVWKGASGQWLAEFHETDESGDWYQYVTYCFKSDGFLRGVLSDLNTAWGWAVVQEFTWTGYKPGDASAPFIAHPVEYRNLESWDKIDLPESPIRADKFYADKHPVLFHRLTSLPLCVLCGRR